MATRLPLSDSAGGFTPATIKGTWTNSSATLLRLLGEKSGTEQVANVAPGSFVTNHDRLAGRWVSRPIAADVSITGTMTWIYVGAFTSSGTPTVISKAHVWVTTGGTDTVRGTLLANQLGADNYTATLTGRGDGAIAITTVAAQAGDRIVLELGMRITSAFNINDAGRLAYGGTGADRTDGSTTVGDPGWIEFSTNITFAAEALGPPPGRGIDRIRHLLVR